MQTPSPEEQKQTLAQKLMLKYITDNREKHKKVKEVFASGEQGHHAMFTKNKGRGTPKRKRKAEELARRINRHK